MNGLAYIIDTLGSPLTLELLHGMHFITALGVKLSTFGDREAEKLIKHINEHPESLFVWGDYDTSIPNFVDNVVQEQIEIYYFRLPSADTQDKKFRECPGKIDTKGIKELINQIITSWDITNKKLFQLTFQELIILKIFFNLNELAEPLIRSLNIDNPSLFFTKISKIDADMPGSNVLQILALASKKTEIEILEVGYLIELAKEKQQQVRVLSDNSFNLITTSAHKIYFSMFFPSSNEFNYDRFNRVMYFLSCLFHAILAREAEIATTPLEIAFVGHFQYLDYKVLKHFFKKFSRDN